MSGNINPHSNFVTGALKNRSDFAAALLRLTLDPRVLERVDLDALRVEDGTFIEPNLRQSRTDLLFSIPGKAGGANRNVYVLFEHKSRPEPNLLLQLLKYQRVVYEWQAVKMPVVAVVLYHGQARWNVPDSFHGYLRLTHRQTQGFGDSVLNFRYDLLDVCRMDIQRLRASLAFRCFLNVLAEIHRFGDPERIAAFLRLYRELFFDITEQEFVEKFLFYMLEYLDIESGKLRTYIEKNVATEKGELVMSTAERLRNEGRVEGKLEGKLEDAKNFLENGVDLEIVLKSTGLTREQLKEAKIIS